MLNDGLDVRQLCRGRAQLCLEYKPETAQFS